MMEFKRVLLLRPDKAGDAIKTLPVLRAVRQKFPEVEFHLVVSKDNASIFSFEPGIQSHLEVVPEGMAFDAVVNLLSDPHPMVDRYFSVQSKKYFSVPLNRSLHNIRPLNLLITPVGQDESLNISRLLSQVFRVDVTTDWENFPKGPILCDKDHEEAATLGPKNEIWLAICPFSGTAQRTFPIKKWKKFFTRSFAPFERIIMFGTKTHLAQLEAFKANMENPGNVNLVFPSTFRTLGAYLLRMDGVLAVDSGPLHLARSLGINSLGFLSGGDHKRWYPNRVPHRILRRGLFSRFPSTIEMGRAFSSWSRYCTVSCLNAG